MYGGVSVDVKILFFLFFAQSLNLLLSYFFLYREFYKFQNKSKEKSSTLQTKQTNKQMKLNTMMSTFKFFLH